MFPLSYQSKNLMAGSPNNDNGTVHTQQNGTLVQHPKLYSAPFVPVAAASLVPENIPSASSSGVDLNGMERMTEMANLTIQEPASNDPSGTVMNSGQSNYCNSLASVALTPTQSRQDNTPTFSSSANKMPRNMKYPDAGKFLPFYRTFNILLLLH